MRVKFFEREGGCQRQQKPSGRKHTSLRYAFYSPSLFVRFSFLSLLVCVSFFFPLPLFVVSLSSYSRSYLLHPSPLLAFASHCSSHYLARIHARARSVINRYSLPSPSPFQPIFSYLQEKLTRCPSYIRIASSIPTTDLDSILPYHTVPIPHLTSYVTKRIQQFKSHSGCQQIGSSRPTLCHFFLFPFPFPLDTADFSRDPYRFSARTISILSSLFSRRYRFSLDLFLGQRSKKFTQGALKYEPAHVDVSLSLDSFPSILLLRSFLCFSLNSIVHRSPNKKKCIHRFCF